MKDQVVPPDLRIQMLGEFTVWVDNEKIPEKQWHSRRACSLIKLLALSHGRRMARDQVAETLWPDSDPAASANNFHQSLYAARGIVGAQHLVLEDGWLQLVVSSVDTEAFETAAEQARASHASADYQAAVTLYTGDLLPSDLYEEWAVQQREGLRQVYLELLLALARLYEQGEEYCPAIETLLKLLTCERSHEEAHAALMRLYAKSGQCRLALRQYDLLRESLRRELDAEPSDSTTRLYQAILSGAFAPPQESLPSPCNLPAQLTSFIGREREIEALIELFQSDHARLVVVTGAGGTGKTRLALRAAEALRSAYPGGTWLVELAPLINPDLVPSAAVSALGLIESSGSTPTQTLEAYLRARQALIVLDNCEHVITAAAALTEHLLRACPRLAILATSRELLGVGGEAHFYCPSLQVPGEPDSPWQAQAACEALRLFAERAALVSPGFHLAEQNVQAVAEVCRRLDGIPLAIEMAAARVRLLPVDQIASRLDHAFQLLAPGPRTALPRHQTLKAAIDWSFDLLAEPERILLRRVSVFLGGWTLEAAEEVCAGEDLPAAEILERLGSLVDKSMVLVEGQPDLAPRYRLLEPIRQYALDRLRESGQEPALRERHLVYFTRLAEQAEPHMHTRSMLEWLDRLDQEFGNLRLALELAASSSVEHGLRLSAALIWFWHNRAHRDEGIAWIDRMLAADSIGPDEIKIGVCDHSPQRRAARARALFAAGCLRGMDRIRYPDWNATREIRRQSRAIFEALGDGWQKELAACDLMLQPRENLKKILQDIRKAGDRFWERQCLTALTNYSFCQGDMQGYRQYNAERLAIVRETGDMDGEGLHFYSDQAYLSFEGQYLQAVEAGKIAQACFQAIGHREYVHMVTIRKGFTEVLAGNYQQAVAYASEALRNLQELNIQRGIIESMEILAYAFWCLGELDQAERWCKELLPYTKNYSDVFYSYALLEISRGEPARAAPFMRDIIKNFMSALLLFQTDQLRRLMLLAAALHQERRAALLGGAVDRILASAPQFKHFWAPKEIELCEQFLASARAALGEEQFQAAQNEGREMNMEQLYRVLLEVVGEN